MVSDKQRTAFSRLETDAEYLARLESEVRKYPDQFSNRRTGESVEMWGEILGRPRQIVWRDAGDR